MTEADPIVYVIDDDVSVRNALRRLFKSIGIEVVTFSSAKAFLELERPDRPACLVLDVRMPGLSGLDLQEKLAASGVPIPIVFITGHGDIPMSVRAMKAGASDFLSKPINDQDLIDAVQRALDRHAADRERCHEIDRIQRRVESMTEREHEVFVRVVTGMLNKQIALQLGITEKTVKMHRANVMTKMKAGSLADLVRMAERAGVDGPEG